MIGELGAQRSRCRRPVLDVQPVEFARNRIALDDERLRVSERGALSCLNEMFENNAAQSAECAKQFPSLAVFPANPDRHYFSNTQRNEIVHDRPPRAGLGTDTGDIMHRQSSLDRNLCASRIELKVAIETKVTDDRDAHLRITARDFGEARRGHSESVQFSVLSGKWTFVASD